MSHNAIHELTPIAAAARQKRIAASRETWRECDECGETLGVTAFAKEHPHVCRYCRGEVRHKAKARIRRSKS